MKLYYDVPEGSYYHNQVFLEMIDDDITIQPESKYPIKFTHGIEFISYSLAHESATMDVHDIYGVIYTNSDTIYDMFAMYFNYQRKGGGLIDWDNPHKNWRQELQRRKQYTPPNSKYFTTGYYSGVYMFINPELTVYAMIGKTKSFGKPVYCWTNEFMSADELIKEHPHLSKHKAYLNWLQEEADAGRIKVKGTSVSINQIELKKFLK